MTIRPTVRLSDRSIQRITQRTERFTAERAWRACEEAARMMEAEVVAIVRSEFIPDRAPHRRKTQTTRLVNSFQGEVVGTRGRLPVSARLTTKRGVNARKVAALEHGAKPHTIQGANGLSFPGRFGESANQWSNPRLRNAYGDNDFYTRRPVSHPGNRPYRMMWRARQRTARKLPSIIT